MVQHTKQEVAHFDHGFILYHLLAHHRQPQATDAKPTGNAIVSEAALVLRLMTIHLCEEGAHHGVEKGQHFGPPWLVW